MSIQEEATKILMAFVAGALLGIEREYHNKPAGFRTMILICVGSCLFAILSQFTPANPDRIASNIVTGIGFIGAGVIFKEGINVKGITSAALIWVTAAIGMSIGLGYYVVAIIVVALVLATVIILYWAEQKIDKLHQSKSYKITFPANEYSIQQLETEFNTLGMGFERVYVTKQNNIICVYYRIDVTKKMHDALNQFLIETQAISFEV
jgi:putative Mg2+ transporter-C (MgtC) family protein